MFADIKRNKYYGILLDSTPDLGHREQLSEVIRYVDVNFSTKIVCIKESFIGFIELHAKDAATLETVIIEKLKLDDLPLADCRSQCYDNASVMSGHLSGLQQRLHARNHRALFVNCDNHSLNLAGVHAAKQDPVVITFFGTLDRLYAFFSSSTLRWDQLKSAISVTVKCGCETRWSARAEAVKAMHKGFEELVALLEKLSEDRSQTPETRSDADSLLRNVLNFNFMVLLHFWHNLLSKIDRVQKRLQDPRMNFHDASLDLESLEEELINCRETLCHDSVHNAKSNCTKWGINIDKRIRRRRVMPGEVARDAGLSAEEEITRVLIGILDRLRQEITTHFTRLKDLDAKFGFLLDVQNLFAPDRVENIHQNCIDLASFYDTDIDGDDLCAEISDCGMLLKSRIDSAPATALELLQFVVSYGDDVFPNLRVAIQIMLTIAVSIASCERSFSKLKLILSYLRASMGQERLSALAILSTERETLEKIDLDMIVDQFTSAKARKSGLKF